MDSPIWVEIPRHGKTEADLIAEIDFWLHVRDHCLGATVTDDSVILRFAPDVWPVERVA